MDERIRKVWAGDWRAKLYDRLREKGFGSLESWLVRYPAVPYLSLADMLAEDVAAIQIEKLQFEEAVRDGKLREAAMDAIVREIQYHLSKGWKQNSQGDFDTASAYATWITKVVIADTRFEGSAKGVWDALKTQQPAVGWLPKDPNDPLIVEAFNSAWIAG